MLGESIAWVRRHKIATGAVVAAAALYGVLSIPEPAPQPPESSEHLRFRWNQDDRWLGLEQRFQQARAVGCDGLRESIDTRLQRGEQLLRQVGTRRFPPDAPLFDSVEDNTFQLGPMIGACFERLSAYIHLVTQTRSVVKRQSERWDMDARVTKDRLYRLLWGGRAALEEVMLQGPAASVPALVLGDDEPSATPFARILGVTIHSGDLLVSRAGAASSALIAVGNDYPGNFSHVVIAYVDDKTSLATVVQSDEKGLHLSTLEEYLQAVKLRVMVLRLRADLPQVRADPMLPHKAAALVLARASSGHTPYDFEIDHRDDSKMYCSEVPAWAYEQVGVHLWMEISRISAPGTRAWLTDLGVKRFDTQEPSDLEYDPQLRVVAEWRDPHTLYLDHVDNVITEALLEGAARGDRLRYAWYLLPVVRLLKGYSMLLNVAGETGPIPEGLSATVAARVVTLERRHRAIKRRVLALADEFRSRQGYTPPEWQLLSFAKHGRDELQ